MQLETIGDEQRERIRLALGALTRAGSSITVRALRRAAQVGSREAELVARLHRLGRLPPLDQPWSAGPSAPASTAAPAAPPRPPGQPIEPPPPRRREEPPQREPLSQEFLDAIRSARDLDGLARVTNEVAVLLAEDKLEPNTARALRDLIQEQRRGLIEAAKHAEVDEEGALIPCTEEGAELVRAFEAIEDGATRAELLELTRRRLEVERERRSAAVGAGAQESCPDPA